MEEEQSGRADLQRLVQKANSEAALWRQKCESGEGGVRSEEMEEMKKKLTARLIEAESQLEAALSKAASMDKANHRLRGELEDLSIEVERVSISQASARRSYIKPRHTGQHDGPPHLGQFGSTEWSCPSSVYTPGDGYNDQILAVLV